MKLSEHDICGCFQLGWGEDFDVCILIPYYAMKHIEKLKVMVRWIEVRKYFKSSVSKILQKLIVRCLREWRRRM